MKVKNHRLYGDDGRAVAFDATPNKSSRGLTGGKPKFVIIHYTAGGSARSAINTFNNKKSQASAHIVIGHDGAITQMARFNERCWHAGRSEWGSINGLNSHSVGIEIANWGPLMGEVGNWKSWVGTSVPDNRVLRAKHKNENTRRGWEVYDPEQVESCVSMVRAIADAYGLGPDDILGHDDISPGRKTDPGPAWDMKRFRASVFGRKVDTPRPKATYRVIAQNGLNMRDAGSISGNKIDLLPHGTELEKIEESGSWWLVSKVVNGEPDESGWVHSRYVQRA